LFPLDLQVLLGEAEAPLQVERPQPATSPKISDWLSFNDLTRKFVVRHLALIESCNFASEAASSNSTGINIPANEAWSICATSMREAFPELSDEITQVESITTKSLEPKTMKYPQPFTYDLGFQVLPFVSVHYKNRASDLLAMAHEFGHAVQIVASWKGGKGQMPAVARECCAFIAELALVQFCEDQFNALEDAYHADDNIYFGAHKTSLEVALRYEQQPYQYDWNYPLARHFAYQLFQRSDSAQLSAIYRAGKSGGQLLSCVADNIQIEGVAA
jgi:hypothetical protein